MAKKSGGLGRGLDALFADAPSFEIEEKEEKKTSTKSSSTPEPADNAIVYIDINDIEPNKNQPRKTFDQDKLEDLANSIIENGIIQPIVVRKTGNTYEIVAGERRWRASRIAQLKTVPCIVRTLSDEENMLFAIIENMQREDLNPVEEARGLEQMIENYGLTQEQVSKAVGKSRPYIANCLRLLKLPQEVLALVEDGSISNGHARALINMKDDKEKLKLANKAAKEGLSVREVENIVKDGPKKKAEPRKKRKDPNLEQVEADLKKALGTKVNIKESGKKGVIEIEYYNKEELERLIALLKDL
ncbi:MAG: ParB/RepB/Spo0J family partition protein [Clostridia bacterium]|nr:ParB/RepB/Spo0J family partition protein [Clostridia bacterium]